MVDYFCPTVVQPTIPNADMTPLERLLLMKIFESEPEGDGLYFFAEIMPADQFELPVETLRKALAASDGVASQAATFVIDRLKDAGRDYADIELDLSATSWEFIFQDIIERSATLDHVTVVSAFTCSRRPLPDRLFTAIGFIARLPSRAFLFWSSTISIPKYISTNFDALHPTAILRRWSALPPSHPDMSSTPSGARARTTSSRHWPPSMAIPTTPSCRQPKPCRSDRRPDPAAVNRVWTRRFACQRASRFRFAFGDA